MKEAILDQAVAVLLPLEGAFLVKVARLQLAVFQAARSLEQVAGVSAQGHSR